MQPDSASLLWDVLDAAAHIGDFLVGVGEDAYATDVLRRSAVERQLEIIGEALRSLRRVDPETASQVPDLVRIIGLRNVLAHGYASVDDSIVWRAATAQVPQLRRVVEVLLADQGQVDR